MKIIFTKKVWKILLIVLGIVIYVPLTLEAGIWIALLFLIAHSILSYLFLKSEKKHYLYSLIVIALLYILIAFVPLTTCDICSDVYGNECNVRCDCLGLKRMRIWLGFTESSCFGIKLNCYDREFLSSYPPVQKINKVDCEKSIWHNKTSL